MLVFFLFVSKLDLWKCMSKSLAQTELLHVEHIVFLDYVSKEMCSWNGYTSQQSVFTMLNDEELCLPVEALLKKISAQDFQETMERQMYVFSYSDEVPNLEEKPVLGYSFLSHGIQCNVAYWPKKCGLEMLPCQVLTNVRLKMFLFIAIPH